MSDVIIIGKDCEKCIHAKIIEKSKANIKVFCDITDKQYYWGMCLQCAYREVKNAK